MTKLVIAGGGGHAKVLIAVARKCGYDVVGYTDPKDHGVVSGVRYLGADQNLAAVKKSKRVKLAAIGVGSVGVSEVRQGIVDRLLSMGFVLPPIVSPDAIVDESVVAGDGTVIFDGAIVNAGAHLGVGVIVNTHATVEHDCEIGDFVHVASGATLSGAVRVDKGSMVGAGATIIQGIKIGAGCMIGAGSVVVEDCLEPGVYVGNPARKIR